MASSLSLSFLIQTAGRKNRMAEQSVIPTPIQLTMYDQSYIVSWIGVGMTLCSAILFFLAAVCIKNDKEREDAMNLQYLMPVYPQKQQSYGPYGYAAYPGPAAYYGSQYGLPYN